MVPGAGDARRGVARREGEIGGGQRRAAAGENLRRHREVPVHQQAGAPVRNQDLADRGGDAAAGDEGRAVVRDGRRRHRFRDGKPNSRSEEIRP